MNIVRQPRTLLVRGRNAEMGTAAGSDELDSQKYALSTFVISSAHGKPFEGYLDPVLGAVTSFCQLLARTAHVSRKILKNDI